MSPQTVSIAVVIPCYKVKKHIIGVIQAIPENVSKIYVVDDKCPENTGSYVNTEISDRRIQVLYNSVNKGVGGAVMAGYRQAINDGIDIVVKIDGDGQMDPLLINNFINPILLGEADYTKGNRFFNLESLDAMPKIRLIGNALLSLMTKFSSGYWNLFDPTNGYTAIHCEVAKYLPFDKISSRYFFETDMLFRLNTLNAVVVDIPMEAKYEDEESNLKISKIIGDFMFKHIRNTFKRIFYNYYLRDMSLASFELPIGICMLIFGAIYGGIHWYESLVHNSTTATGTVVLSALNLIIGIQLILAFIGHDISSTPKHVLHRKMLTRWRSNHPHEK